MERKLLFDLSPLSVMSRPCSHSAPGGVARLLRPRRGRSKRLRALPTALLELPHLQQQQQQQRPLLELASSSTSTPSALGAAISTATDLLFSSSSSPAPAPSLTAEEEEEDGEEGEEGVYEADGAGARSALAVASAIEKDFSNDYFVTGKISGEVYSRDCAFVDPTVSVEGLSAWRKNIALLRRYLDSPRIELIGDKVAVVGEEEGLRAEGDFARGDALALAAAASSSSSGGGEEGTEGGPSSRHAVVARWRLVAPVSKSLLPWRPVVDVQGVTVYRLAGEGEEGGGEEEKVEEAEGNGASSSVSPSSPSPPPRVVVVVRHTESWSTSPWAALAQLLVPGGKGEVK